MRRLTTYMLLTSLVFSMVNVSLNAQDAEKKSQLFSVHADYVYPSKIKQYKDWGKKLNQYVKESGVSMDWATASMDDGTFLYIAPIDNFAEMDERPFDAVEKKVGKEAMDKLWAGFDECYASHKSYMLSLDYSLSYMPDGMKISMKDDISRKFIRLDFKAKDAKAVKEVMKKFKEAYEKTNPPLAYRVYHASFGEEGPYVWVVISGKDRVDIETRSAKTREILGDVRNQLNEELMKYITAIDVTYGQMEPEMSYGTLNLAESSR